MSNKIQRKYKGLKITVGAQLGQIVDNKIHRDQKPNCHFSGVRNKSRVLFITPRGCADLLNTPLQPRHGSTPTLESFRDQLTPSPREQARAPIPIIWRA